ncbi:tetraacyldisaccharide 4'-kinase [Pontibacter diazotrophicus]|uniref:Tetraacyldisaccharide 4'-kinase n=2 Tax=Pontibacter diazotrophicus TaxID=1400979 RepID=A0A3D8LGT2_9BACT|nr:tetraacyldisaccharide 4'-kinase [Pontibacter diazotrophicus]
MKYLKLLLWPFSLLYGGVTVARNILYDKGTLTSTRFDLPVIAVGNLTVGGTGKTPHVEYLLRLLQQYKVATLSRGYKRQSKGFLLADGQSTAAILGDEPYQYHRDFQGVAVAVSEDRVAGIQKLQQLVPELAAVVLDDAMQHRPVQPSLNILITDYNRPFYKDFVLPAGLLREPRQGAARADAVIMSKCPLQLDMQEQGNIRSEIEKYTAPDTPVFFSAFVYGAPVAIGLPVAPTQKVVLLTGIANAQPLKEYLASDGYKMVHHLEYPDHHQYSAQDLQKLKQLLQQPVFSGATILTTRKDAVKLAGPELESLTKKLPVFYIPIVVQLLGLQERFDQLVLQHVRQFQKPITQ